MQHPPSRLGGRSQAQLCALGLLVQEHVADFDAITVLMHEPATIDLQIEGVEDDRLHRFVHLDRDVDLSGERGCIQVGFDREVVPGRHDGAWETVAVLHGRRGAYREGPGRDVMATTLDTGAHRSMQRPRSEEATGALVPVMDPASEFELFFEVEHERLHHAVYMATGSRSEAEARAQGAFRHAWERWDRVRAMERPSLFVFRRAMNPLRAAFAHRRYAIRRGLRHEPSLEPFEDVQLDERVRRSLLDLVPPQRSASALVKSLDLTPGEAGRTLGRRAATIRLDLEAAQAIIRDHMEPVTSSVAEDRDPMSEMLDAVRRAAAPAPGAFDRHLAIRARVARRRRLTTVAIVAVVSAIVAFAAGRSTGPEPPRRIEGTDRSADPSTTRYQLPGMLMAASVEIPDGWRVDDSIWGSGGVGLAALSTGQEGSTVSVAVFDLVLLNPFDPGSGEVRILSANGRERWFARFERRFDRQARARLVPYGSIDLRRFHAWSPLPWLVAHEPARGPIHVSEPLIDEREGSLVSFVKTGSTAALFTSFGDGRVVMRPGVTYAFWAPAQGESLAGEVVVGIAREPGATAGTEAWDLIRSLSLRSY